MKTKSDRDELEFKVIDEINLSKSVNNFIGLESSQDGCICVITNVGLYINYFRGYMDNFLKISSLSKLFFKPSDYSISDSLGIEADMFVDYIPQNDLYELLLRTDLFPKLKTSEKSQVLSVKFSPAGLISGTGCAITVLTNFGSLELYMRRVKINFIEEFVCICNISQFLVNNFSAIKKWGSVKCFTPIEKFEELKKRVDDVKPLCFAWSHLYRLDNEKFCILIVGHKGALTFFKIHSQKTEDESNFPIILKRSEVSLNDITLLEWVKAENDGLLLVGDNMGKISAFCISLATENSINISKEVIIFDQNDLIKVEFLRTHKVEDKFYLFIVKGTFLLIIALDREGNILDKGLINIDNFCIIDLQHYEKDLFFVLTFSGVLLQLKIFWEIDKMIILKKYIHLKVNFGVRRAQGLYISPNKVFMCILAPIFRLISTRKTKSITKLLILKNCAKNPLDILLENETGSIEKYWDCLEILRLNTLVDKSLPCNLPEKFNYDSLPLPQLKSYMWLAKSSETIIKRIQENDNLKSYQDIKQMLQIKLIVKHMKNLLNQKSKMTKFQMQSLFLHNLYLKDLVYDDTILKLGFSNETIGSVIEVLRKSNSLKYPEPPTCFICKDNLNGPQCFPLHEDNRCVISNMQIIKPPYYKCPYCKCNAHKEVEKELYPIFCPFCDVEMEHVNDDLKNVEETILDGSLENDAVEETEINLMEFFNVSSDEESEIEMAVDE